MELDSYPGQQSIAIASALGNFTPSDGDKIKGRNGTADYLAVMNMWLGTLNSFEPGQGYMYMSNSNVDKTLVYQTNRQEGSTIVNNNSIEMIFEPEIDHYAYNMTITAVVELAGDELRSENYELAAFVGNECRGSVKLMYVEPLDRYMAFLLVFGDKEENLNFVLSDGKDAGWSNDSFVYSDNRVIGSLNDLRSYTLAHWVLTIISLPQLMFTQTRLRMSLMFLVTTFVKLKLSMFMVRLYIQRKLALITCNLTSEITLQALIFSVL